MNTVSIIVCNCTPRIVYVVQDRLDVGVGISHFVPQKPGLTARDVVLVHEFIYLLLVLCIQIIPVADTTSLTGSESVSIVTPTGDSLTK